MRQVVSQRGSHRRDYILLDKKIRNAYMEVMKTEKRIPSQIEVAAKCKISRETVGRHLNAIDLSELVKPFKLFGNDVMMGLRNKAISGDVQAAKLFFMLTFDWSEKQEHTVDLSGAITQNTSITLKPDEAKAVGKLLAKLGSEEKT